MLRARKALRVWAVLVVVASAATTLCQRPGDLVVTPTRVSLDSKTKAGDVTLLNRSTQTVRYRLSFIDMEMSEEGVLHRLTAKPEFSGSNFFRFSPREIVLQPGESQRIKILAAFPAGTKEGEYRSHLSFEPILPPRLPHTGGGDGQGLTLRLQLKSVVTIPVIARHGQLSASATISDAKVLKDPEGWLARFKISRSGSRTVRGDVTVSFIPAKGGPKVVLGEISSLPVYFPNSHRIVSVRLTRDVAKLGKGEIEVRFNEPDRSRGAAAATTLAAITE